MKLTEKELNEFPIGTKITTTQFTYIKHGKDIFKSNVRENQNVHTNNDMLFYKITKVEIPTYTEYIPPKPILDEKEKEYLSAVIRPWRSRVESIKKTNGSAGINEWIRIYLKDSMFISLPTFKPNTMYKGMKLDREYTLEDLRFIVD